MSVDPIEDRVLGAVQFVDAPLRLQVDAALQVAAPGITWLRNRAGLYVIVACTGLERYRDSFEAQPSSRAIGSVRRTASVTDPSGHYLARRFELRLPRDPAPDAPVETSLFQPLTVPLYPAAHAAVLPNWALLRVAVTRGARRQPAAGALLRVRRADGSLLAEGLSDGRGEALVAVPGVPVTTWSEADDGAVVASEIDAQLDTVFDAGARGLPDPDALAAAGDGVLRASVALRLKSGRTEVLSVGL